MNSTIQNHPGESLAARYLIAMNNAALAENLSVSTFVIMLETHSHEEPPSLAAVSVATGYSYWSLRNQVERTSYFVKIYGGPLIKLKLSRDGLKKLLQVNRRIARILAGIASENPSSPILTSP